MEFNKEVIKELIVDGIKGRDEAIIKEAFWQTKVVQEEKNNEFLVNLSHLQHQIKELGEWLEFLHQYE